MTACEDCGDDCKRRTRCKRCGMLVCGWCYNHVHGLQFVPAAEECTLALPREVV